MVITITGSNTFATRSELDNVIKSYLDETSSDLGLERLEGDGLEVGQLRTILQTAPFLIPKRLVVIKQISQNKPVAEWLESSLDIVPDTTDLILYEPQLDQRSKIFKNLERKTDFRAFSALNLPQLLDWIKNDTKQLGGEIDSPTANQLVERVGEDQWRLHSELEKMINISSNITPELISDMVEASPSNTIFELLDTLAAGQIPEAIKHYRDLRAQKLEPGYVISMIAWQLHNLLVVKAAGSRSAADIAKHAKMSPFVVRKTLGLARRIRFETLKKILEAAIEADYQMKTSSSSPDHLLEQLIYKIGREFKTS